MTYLETINAVLRRLREDEVSTPTESEYSTLIGDFVRATVREVEAAWNWTFLRTTVPITTAQGTTSYTLTGAGRNFRTMDVYDTTSKQWLNARHSMLMKQEILNADQGVPNSYYFEGVDTSGDTTVFFSPVADGVYVINFELIVPQANNLSAGGTAIKVDPDAVYLGAYSKAVAERGEDGGTAMNRADAAYKLAVGDAVAIDMSHTVGEDMWHV
ncbi:MAG: phage adaptor protein [Candidatus Thorarchaeota archaeon]|jgi:hypothetical protein